jgi:hypothetical protein
MSQELKQKIMGAIQKGEVTMRPRWHFVLRSTLLVLGIVIMGLSLVFLSSFVLFLLRANGVIFAPLFGFRGLRSFIFALPWILIGLSFLFIVILEILARFYGAGRKTPLLYSAAGVIGVVTLCTALVGYAGFHERLSMRAFEGRLPVMGGMYREIPMAQHVYRGRIISVFDQQFIIEHRRGTTTILIDEKTGFPHGTDLGEGDVVVIIGDRTGDSVQAEGVMKVDEMDFDPRKRGKMFREGDRSRPMMFFVAPTTTLK